MEISDPGRGTGAAVVERLRRAINGHDLDAIVDCFAPDYRAQTPVHPDRDFVGREHVRRNWGGLLQAVPDVTATVTRLVECHGGADADTVVWAEWEQSGTPRDGSTHLVRGVVILGVVDDRASWVRFYLEPVQGTRATPPPAG